MNNPKIDSDQKRLRKKGIYDSSIIGPDNIEPRVQTSDTLPPINSNK